MPTVLPALNRPVRLAVLISGGGTTLLNLLEKSRAGQIDAEFPIIIASKENCRGVERARAAGLRCEPVVRSQFDSVETFSDRIFALCREAEVDLVILGGFLSLVQIPSDFEHRVINIHPSLIPAFCGKGFHGHHVHEAVLERGAKVSGCTVHFANNYCPSIFEFLCHRRVVGWYKSLKNLQAAVTTKFTLPYSSQTK